MALLNQKRVRKMYNKEIGDLRRSPLAGEAILIARFSVPEFPLQNAIRCSAFKTGVRAPGYVRYALEVTRRWDVPFAAGADVLWAANWQPGFHPDENADLTGFVWLTRPLPFGYHNGVRWEHMKRVVILGRGASGKSTLAKRLGSITGLPVIELDKIFWRPGVVATPRDQWVIAQEKLVAEDRWIMDGDLGPYDVVEVRLQAADTIIFLDFSFVRCAWRAIRRLRERADFWRWLWAYPYQSRPILMQSIAKHASAAELHVLRDPNALMRFIVDVARERPDT
jgi:nicotinamide riboside kinase